MSHVYERGHEEKTLILPCWVNSTLILPCWIASYFFVQASRKNDTIVLDWLDQSDYFAYILYMYIYLFTQVIVYGN